MTNPIMGEIRPFLGDFAPDGWAICNGVSLAIADYELLHELIGDSFGAAEPGMFKLPDLIRRIALGAGSGTGLTPRTLGQTGGADATFTDARHLPSHSHMLVVDPGAPDTEAPAGAMLAPSPQDYRGYASPSDCTVLQLAPEAVSIAPSPNTVTPSQLLGMRYNGMPSCQVTYIISLTGDYPSFSSGSE